MRFVCDEMLKRLGQWLRVAGYDVLMLPDGSADSLLFERAIKEQRLLLTRDRKLAEYRDAEKTVLVLECNDLESCVEVLSRHLDIDWLYQPFSRCMNCNTSLIPAPQERWNEVPDDSRARAEALFLCPSCDQLFWDGSHVQQMRRRLQQWAKRFSH